MIAKSSIIDDSSGQEIWKKVQLRLREEYGDATFDSWFKHLELFEINNSEITLVCPTRFIREWIQTNYKNKIKNIWRVFDAKVMVVSIIVRSAAKNQLPEGGKKIVSGVDVTGQNIDVLETPNANTIGSPLDRRFTFENFVVGESNHLAFAAAKATADSKEIISGNNPFYIYGGVGLGKTHLIHALAWAIKKQNPSHRVMYLSAERFMFQFFQALRDKSIMSFKEQFRSTDVLIIDDIQFICGKESTQEEFHHTCNALLDRNKQLIISGDRAPCDLEGMKDRIRSRLGWGLVVDINQTSYDLRVGILRSKVVQMKDTQVPDDVVGFLAGKIASNVRELEGALNKVVAYSKLVGNPISLDTTKEVLSDLLRAHERAVTIFDIQKTVANFYNLKLCDMSSARRARCVARPRQVAMYLCKYNTQRSLSEIGNKFGGKDHTTVMHAVKRIESLIEKDDEVKADLDKLTKLLVPSL